MENEHKKKIINSYISSYNAFDIDGMIKDMDEGVCFQNISNNEINMETNGLENFVKVAKQAKDIFLTREQIPLSYDFKDNMVTVGIDYKGELASDLPNGLKKGETINLNGKSEFYFKDSKIVKLIDIS